jgi:N-acetylglucosaminyldiphosphoundecaprenol N-acetyl-beta-D-mannosaminyltransferase
MRTPPKHALLGVGLTPISRRDVLASCQYWVQDRRSNPSGLSRYIVLLTVHSVMTAFFDAAYRAVLNASSIGATDGMPLAWALRAAGYGKQPRVYGPDLMLDLCEQAATLGYRIYLYGGREGVLDVLQQRLAGRFPGLSIVGAYAPPFRPLTAEEDRRCVDCIVASGADIVFVGIGVPKQEKWMFGHAARLPGVIMLGVGAAFDFHAGRIRQAPAWMQRSSLEWLFRLLMEPRRLWKRYLLNPLFLLCWGLEALGVRLVRATAGNESIQ